MTTLFATRPRPAFHALGTSFDVDENVTTAKMLADTKLADWNVRLEEIKPEADEDWVTPAFKVKRTNPDDATRNDVLATVGTRYKVLQNEQLFAFGDSLLDGGGHWVAAGARGTGRQVFGTLKIDRDINVGGVDAVGLYLMVVTSHDGTLGVRAIVTPIRIYCMNALNLAIKKAVASFKIRHTQTIEGRLAVARQTLDLTFKYADAFSTEANALYEVAMTNAEFNRIVTDLYPKPEADKKGALTRWENKVGLLGDIFVGDVSDYGTINTIENVQGTAWAGLNALTERLDWYRKPRAGSDSVLAGASGLDAVVNAEKNRIHARVLEFAKEKGAPVLV